MVPGKTRQAPQRLQNDFALVVAQGSRARHAGYGLDRGSLAQQTHTTGVADFSHEIVIAHYYE